MSNLYKNIMNMTKPHFILQFTTVTKTVFPSFGGRAGETNGTKAWEMFLSGKTSATSGPEFFFISKTLMEPFFCFVLVFLAADGQMDRTGSCIHPSIPLDPRGQEKSCQAEGEPGQTLLGAVNGHSDRQSEPSRSPSDCRFSSGAQGLQQLSAITDWLFPSALSSVIRGLLNGHSFASAP